MRKYLDHTEVYDVDNTVVGGHVRSRSSYLSTLGEEELDKIGYVSIRLGKRLLMDGNVSVTVIVHDLAELPIAEQRYWHSYEIDEPEFASHDPDFETYYRRNFEAEWLDDNDPLTQTLDEIKKVNSMFGGQRLYSQESNPYLSYPVVNTYKAFCDSCSELYKVVGPDNLVEKTIKDLLRTRFGYSEADFIHRESGRPIGKLELFKRLCKAIDLSNFADVVDKIREHRVSADHQIISPQLPNQNFITEFRRITQDLCSNLKVFIDKLASNE